MNWVGGSRSRFMKNKEDTVKQKAFFQKQRMKSKSKTVDPKAPATQNCSGNVDLLTLFIVNQISSKKIHAGKPKVNLFDAKETTKTIYEPLDLPMSPCSPSNLNLATSQPHYSVDTAGDTSGFEVRKHHIAKEFKFRPLSPLLESNLSDAGGPENRPHVLNTAGVLLDPFSIPSRSASHASSSLSTQKIPDPDCMKFVPFSQPMKQANPWTEVSKEAHVLQNRRGAETQFGFTLPNTDTAEESAQLVLFPASPLKSSKQQEEPLFIDFNITDHKENPCSENTSNILETSLSSSIRIQNSDGSQNMGRDDHFLTQEEVDQCLQYASSNEQISQTEDAITSNHCFISVNNSTSISPQAPTCKQQIKELRHESVDQNPPKMKDAGTQTAAVSALSCCDVSVQCSLNIASNTCPTVGYTTNVPNTRRQSVHFNEVSAGASDTKKQAQTHPKTPKGLSFRKPYRQTNTKRTPTPILKRSLRKGLELKVGQPLESREKIERCVRTNAWKL